MQEADVGITSFANDCSGFSAILRHRYSDFKVNEVNTSMQVARLTSVASPAGSASGDGQFSEDAISKCVQAFQDLLGPEQAAKLKQFLQQHARTCDTKTETGNSQNCSSLLFTELPGKAERTAVHNFFKQDFGLPKLVTDTVQQAGAGSAVRVMTQTDLKASVKRDDDDGHGGGRGRGRVRGREGGRNSRGRGQKRSRPSAAGDVRGLNNWEGGSGNPYVLAVLHKENQDTHAAMGVLARATGTETSTFGLAGTKDKRGLTSQYVTAWKIPVARLKAAADRLQGIDLGNFGYTANPLRLGDLAGNAFTLVLRGLPPDGKPEASAAVRGLRDSGFINYFGLQRFGTGATPTHHVGVKLLLGDWEGAVRAIVASRPDDSEWVSQATEAFQAGELDGALKAMPKHMVAERAVIQALQKHGSTAWLTALRAIPRHLRMMYLHACQSYIWNTAASMRVETHGLKVVVGDCVLPGGTWIDGGHASTPIPSLLGDATGDADATQASALAPPGSAPAPPSDGAAEEQREASAAADRAALAGEPAAKRARVEAARPSQTAASRISSVVRVTAEDVAAARYSIEDVVLPLPGRDVQYPDNPEDGDTDTYTQAAAALGVSLTDCPHSEKDFSMASLSGDYRRLIIRPRAFHYHFVRHSSLDEDIMASDVHLMEQTGSAPARLGGIEVPSDKVADAAEAPAQPAPEGGEHPPQTSKARLRDAYSTMEDEVLDVSDIATGKEYLSLVMSFALPSSAYATMMTRELLKGSTSKAEHKAASARQQIQAGE